MPRDPEDFRDDAPDMVTAEPMPLSKEPPRALASETAREHLYRAKQKVVELTQKLQRVERDRADLANKLAMHATSANQLAAIRELVVETAEGVVFHVRPLDEEGDAKGAVYPVVVGTKELKETPAEDWVRVLVHERASAVLAAARAFDYAVVRPDQDAAVRAEHAAAIEAAGVEPGQLVEHLKDAAGRLREYPEQLKSVQTKLGLREKALELAEDRIRELTEQLAAAQAPAEEEVEALVSAGIVTEKKKAEAKRAAKKKAAEEG